MAAQTLQTHACTLGKATRMQASQFSQDCQPCTSFSDAAAFSGSLRGRDIKATASKQTNALHVWKPKEAVRLSPFQRSAIGSLSSSSPTQKPHFRSAERSSSHRLQNERSNPSRGSKLKAQTEESKELNMEKPSTGAPASTKSPFYSRPSFWVQSALVLFALAYIDAAFSGDWSRIGVLSKETEANLRLGAYVVVPSSLIGAWWLGKIIKSYGSPRTR